jgi:hypothetical protein
MSVTTQTNGSTSQSTFGELVKADVRKYWPNEERDFTPWLVKPDNLARLGEAIGLELEFEEAEKACGPYSCDILCKESGSDRYVIIENQFGKTNHDHLGKLITYASALDAGTVVWISEHFTDEHQRALDWLNGHTTEDVSFYAVALELWQIDESRPAVRFNVISRPIEGPVVIDKTLSDTKKQRLEFWTAVRNELLAKHVLASAQTPKPRYWFIVPIGKAKMHISNIMSTNDGRIGVRLYIHNKAAALALAHLGPQREQIEQELGEPLDWNPFPGKRDKIIGVSRKADLDERENWPEYVAWMVTRIQRFREVFGPRVKDLDLSQLGDDDEVDEPEEA